MFERLSHRVQRQLRNVGLLILRVGFGGLLLFNYGLAKAMAIAQDPGDFPGFLGLGAEGSLALATFAELICALLVTLGLFTRLAAIPIVFTMVVAAFLVDADTGWVRQETSVLFALAFLTMVFTGGGAWSLDRLLRRMRARRKHEAIEQRHGAGAPRSDVKSGTTDRKVKGS